MKMKSMLCAVLLGTLAAGCNYHGRLDHLENAEKLRVGMTREQVREIMGEPADVPFAKPDVWYYYTNTKWYDGQTTIDECMPVVFANDKVAGWGKTYVNTQRLIKRPYERPTIEGVK